MGKPAARQGDMHTCPIPIHTGGPIITGNSTVLIGGMPAATVGDTCTCVGPPDTIVQGSNSVFIGGKPAARQGDMTAHGGKITKGCSSVLIGDNGGSTGSNTIPDLDNTNLPTALKRDLAQAGSLKQAAANGAAFSEVCS